MKDDFMRYFGQAESGMTAKIPSGKRVYATGGPPVEAEGLAFSEADLDIALTQRLPPILSDAIGTRLIQELIGGVINTAFASDRLQSALNTPRTMYDWQVGEAMAEAYLIDHRQCEFPWPSGRDLRNPEASPAGADLVGFQTINGGVRFAFGEVKTSTEDKWPPQVVTGRHGLSKQLEILRDSIAVKDHLAFVYLAHRAARASWKSRYRQAIIRYLAKDSDVSLFGFLVRDVGPKPKDLSSRTALLSKNCPPDTTIELRALYLPAGSIPSLAAMAKAKMGGAK